MGTRLKNDLARLEPLFTVNNEYLGMFKKDDYNNSQIKIGRSFLDVDVSKIDPTKIKPKNSVRESLTKLPLPCEQAYFENQKPIQLMDKKDKTYTRERMRSQPITKDVSKFPVRSSEEYGWREPIDIFANYGYGIKSNDGGVVYHQKNPNAVKLKKKE